jgi:hypothetical protein
MLAVEVTTAFGEFPDGKAQERPLIFNTPIRESIKDIK